MEHRLTIWSQGDWRCELHPAPKEGVRLKVFHGNAMIVIEPTVVGEAALTRAAMLRKAFCDRKQMG